MLKNNVGYFYYLQYFRFTCCKSWDEHFGVSISGTFPNFSWKIFC